MWQNISPNTGGSWIHLWKMMVRKNGSSFKRPFLPNDTCNLRLMHELWATTTRVYKSLQSSTFYPRIPDIWTWPQYQVKYLSGEQTAWRHLWAHDQKQTCLRAHAVKGPITSKESEIFLSIFPAATCEQQNGFPTNPSGCDIASVFTFASRKRTFKVHW